MKSEDDHYREILACEELATRIAAHDWHVAAEDHAAYLARNGPPYAGCPDYPNLTPQQISLISDTAHGQVEDARAMASAWLRVRVLLLGALQAAGGEQLP